MRHFLDGEPAPERFDVHIWEAGITVPQQKVRSLESQTQSRSDVPSTHLPSLQFWERM